MDPSIAFFSMEIGLESGMPTYAGGLGMLAGDTLRAAADQRLPLVAVSLLHRRGYFFQHVNEEGWQSEAPVQWPVDDFLHDTGVRTEVQIEGRTVKLRAWRYDVVSVSNEFVVPVFLLDSDLPENADADRHITDYLYGGDLCYRLCQAVVLGVGGVRMLRALGFNSISRFHMNEGHSSFLTLELLRNRLETDGHRQLQHDDLEAVRQQCVFTTHTPVAAGHDQFPMEMAKQVLQSYPAWCVEDVICKDGKLNATYLALTLSHYINGVAKRHGHTSRLLLGSSTIDSITNGVHATTWVAEPIAQLYDRFIPGWREDNYSLRYAMSIPVDEIWNAHWLTKRHLLDSVNHQMNTALDMDVLTIGVARRATAYKRLDMILDDADRLCRIGRYVGQLQIIFAGKAHPQDEPGKELIARIHQIARHLPSEVTVVFVPNYDMRWAKLLTSGSDLWLNTPERPQEASGTSGMKAAVNGVPSCSILDGWWIEGCIEGVTGWAIGDDDHEAGNRKLEVDDLYAKLERMIVPMFYKDRNRFTEIMRHSIALNGSFFNAQRMVQQYVVKAYFV
jgi:starch phosphorylase